MGYKRTHTVQTESDLLTGADQAVRDIAFDPYRYVTDGPFDSATANRFPSADAITIDSPFEQEIDAQTVLTRLISRQQAWRGIFFITLRDRAWEFDIGQSLILKFSRWDLPVPRTGVIVGITERPPAFSSEFLTTLKVWA